MRNDPSTDVGRTEGIYLVACIVCLAAVVVVGAIIGCLIWWPR